MKTDVYNMIILDRSGSMESIRKEAVDGYNETLGSIKAAQLKYLDTQQHFISLAAFCDCGIEMIYNKTPIKDAEKLTVDRYEPCCCTPLYDAVGEVVTSLRRDISHDKDCAVLVTIITDGCENSSREWTAASVAKLIDQCKELGWMFSYIGADHDVMSAAASISITNTVVWTKTTKGTKAVFENENKAREHFYKSMSQHEVGMADEERTQYRRKLSEDYYSKK